MYPPFISTILTSAFGKLNTGQYYKQHFVQQTHLQAKKDFLV